MARKNAINIGVVPGGGNTYTFPSSTDTLVGRGSTDTLTNKTLTAPLYSAGTASAGTAPIRLQAGTLNTTAEAGAIEMDSNCFYGTTDAGNRGYIPVRNFIRATSSRSLANSTSKQAIFNSPANGRLTLETGTYFFEGIISVSDMSAPYVTL